jgi:hypothetical protein
VSVHVRQAEIEDDDVGRLLSGQSNGLLTRFRYRDAIAFVVERRVDQPADRRLIVHNQD